MAEVHQLNNLQANQLYTITLDKTLWHANEHGPSLNHPPTIKIADKINTQPLCYFHDNESIFNIYMIRKPDPSEDTILLQTNSPAYYDIVKNKDKEDKLRELILKNCRNLSE